MSTLTPYHAPVSEPRPSDAADDDHEGSRDRIVGGDPDLIRRVRDAVDVADSQRGSREPRSESKESRPAPSNLIRLDSSQSGITLRTFDRLVPAEDGDEGSQDWIDGGDPDLIRRARDAIDAAASQRSSTDLSSNSDGLLTAARVVALDGLRLQRLIVKANQQTIEIDGGGVLRVDSGGFTAEVPWIEAGDRIVRTVLIATVFGVAGGALGAFAVGDAVMKEAAKVAVGSAVTGVGLAVSEEIWRRLQRGPEPPSAPPLTHG